MTIEIDFNSDEALYIQLRNQIIYGIATQQYHEGDALPSVRQLADEIGINMHTVNKAYSVLRQEGLLRLEPAQGHRHSTGYRPAESRGRDAGCPAGYSGQRFLQRNYPGRGA